MLDKTNRQSGMAYFDQGDYKSASRVSRALLLKDPGNTTVLFHMGLSLYECRQYRRSLKFWLRLKKINPKGLNLNLNMGCVYQNLGRNDLAIRCFKRELILNPFSGEALYNLGTLYYNRRKFRKAVRYLGKCYWLKHSMEVVVDRLADSLFKTGQINEEIELYEDFLKEHPQDTWGLNNIGAALMQLGEYNRARIYLRRALNIEPANQMVLRNIRKAQSLRIPHQRAKLTRECAPLETVKPSNS
jgi:tetratricopeptide (TPR) repeat protein